MQAAGSRTQYFQTAQTGRASRAQPMPMPLLAAGKAMLFEPRPANAVMV
ncbi:MULTISPECIES: hypothetical protein [unclassified Neisseria]|nr:MULTISPECIES: hypothetical protein [unclassified Neisseria]MBF0803735.1 hypothetical protein [Neisseria sp. 19428wB4_WF04]